MEDSKKADQVISELNDRVIGITSEWTLLEMFRAFKKQVNLHILEEEDAKVAVEFFLTDITELVQKNVLKIIPITRELIISSRQLIFKYNLYVADALHAMTTLKNQVSAFITFDSDFKAVNDHIPVINPKNSNIKDVSQLLK